MLHSEARAYARPIALGGRKMNNMLSMSKMEAAMLSLCEAGALSTVSLDLQLLFPFVDQIADAHWHVLYAINCPIACGPCACK